MRGVRFNGDFKAAELAIWPHPEPFSSVCPLIVKLQFMPERYSLSGAFISSTTVAVAAAAAAVLIRE